ncbi:hypothetical protein [Streptomyces sp. A30]|uniref:hypothetical protein n=1 Tax=Streptomyces sp. A30 TaxID=2789273 RepID=UPI00397ECCA3
MTWSLREAEPERETVVSRAQVPPPAVAQPGICQAVGVSAPDSKPGLVRAYGEPVTRSFSRSPRFSHSRARTRPTRPKPCHCWSEPVMTVESAFHAMYRPSIAWSTRSIASGLPYAGLPDHR